MSTLANKVAAREFVVTAELTPPKGIDLTELLAKADALKPYVDAINLTDSPRARMAVEPKAVAHILLTRGIEPIVQITARDRNRIAIQGDLLGWAGRCSEFTTTFFLTYRTRLSCSEAARSVTMLNIDLLWKCK